MGETIERARVLADMAKAKKIRVLQRVKPKRTEFMNDVIDEVYDKPVSKTSIESAKERLEKEKS